MIFPGGSGSPSALSLATTPDAVATLVIAGGVLVVAGATFAYEAYQSYEEKKHRKKIEHINELHKQHLQKIFVPGYEEIRGLPVIFKFIEGKDSSSAESMRMNEQEVRAIGTTLPHGTDASLAEYRESVLNAILKLKDYYFSRKNTTDTTSAVVTYLLYMLETKCFNFAGYNYDIAYLNAIANFINAYASSKGIENSQHFSRLQPVYAYILTAKQLLEKHKESLSLEEVVAELRDCCQDNSNHLIRNFVKLTVKPDYFDLVGTAAHDELKEGKLRKQYVRSEIAGFELCGDPEVELPSSIFKDWTMTLSTYYLESLTPDINFAESLTSPEKILTFFDKAQVVLKEIKLGKTRSKDAKQLKTDLANIADIFKNSPNFISTRLDVTKKKPHFIPVTKDEELLERSRVLANFAKLIHELISLQYLCTHILKSIQLLGEIYVKNPHHFNRIFSVLQNLCGLVIKNTKDIKQEFTDVLKDSNNMMRLEKAEMLPKEIIGKIDATFTIISRLWEYIQNYRNNVAEQCKNKEVRSANYEMLRVGQSLLAMYPEMLVKIPSEKKSNLEKPGLPGNKTGEQASSIIDKDPLPSQSVESSKPASETPVSLPEKSNPQFVEQAKKTLERLMSELSDRLQFIAKESLQDNKLPGYINVVNQLKIMHKKTQALFIEPEKTWQRQQKASDTAELTMYLCQKTLDFLKLSRSERQEQAVIFARKIRTEIENDDNSFIDAHNNSVSKFIYTNVCQFGIFRTDTRRKLVGLDTECQAIATVAK